MIRVLFICTGNICRSPTAEGVFRHLAEKSGKAGAFRIASAGTDAWHAGEPPDARAIACAKRHGVDIAGQRARHLSEADYAGNDYLYAMDRGHLRQMKARAPKQSPAKLAMFLQALTGGGEAEVDDPWYGDAEDFEEAFQLIRDGSAALLNHLVKEHKL